MAKNPTKKSGSTISNIMGLVRGNFDFKTKSDITEGPKEFGGDELISKTAKTKLLSQVSREANPAGRREISVSEIFSAAQGPLNKVGQERLENRKILKLLPDVSKAARLMVASTFSPTDLSRSKIEVVIDGVDFINGVKPQLCEDITNFFDSEFNLKTEAPTWAYQSGYEAGSCVFAVIPLKTFELMADKTYVGTEAFAKEVVDPLTAETIFGFSDTRTPIDKDRDFSALESFAIESVKTTFSEFSDNGTSINIDQKKSEDIKSLVKSFIATEALGLTDNPNVLQIGEFSSTRNSKWAKDKIRNKYQNQQVISPPIPPADSKPLGEPILIKLPPESVTVIHTPGNPNDHQGYLILLDRQGNPIDAVLAEETSSPGSTNLVNSPNQNNLFSQISNAYGMDQGKPQQRKEMLCRLYTEVVEQHIKTRINKSGFSNVSISNSDTMFRYMFSRFLQNRQTRVLFLPKELVCYMSFEKDQYGYGVSRLESIKFALGMKMAVQVSRTLAAIKAAMDKRNLTINFDDNLLESPENVIKTAVGEFLRKSTITFSTDPNVIQNQIAEKSLSIKAKNMPGFEEFDISNEPDNRTGSIDFDSGIMEDIDNQINNGMRIPHSVMNSLGEAEYSRSVVTTNLFFAMDVAIDQDSLKRDISDLIRKIARYSTAFRNIVSKHIPQLDKNSKKKTDETEKGTVESSDAVNIPDDFTIDALIDKMSISLPKPNVAPSKAHYEALTAMVESINSTIDSLLPDDLVGGDDTLRPALAALRSKFKANNIRDYLENAGMGGIEIPTKDFSVAMSEMNNLIEQLQNITNMVKSKGDINAPKEETTSGF